MKAIATTPGVPNSARLIDVPVPKPSENEVLMRMLKVGVDGTDREINEGLYGKPPEGSDFLIVGHEALGIVEDGGSAVKGVEKGDLVVPTVRRTCTENCLNCRNFESDMCLTGNYFEHGIYRLHGFASEFALSDSRYLVKVPEGLLKVAVLLEPLSIIEKALTQTFNIQRRLLWNPQNALVIGVGPIGLLATVLFRLRGLRVVAVARGPPDTNQALLAKEVGAEYVSVSTTPLRQFKERFDIIIECSGVSSVVLDGLTLLNNNGVFCLLGIYGQKLHCEDMEKILTDMVLGNKLILGSVNANKRYFEAGLQRMVEIQQRYGPILQKFITKEVEPEQYQDAFRKDKNDIRTVIRFSETR